jgi:hypothetical protein
MTTEETQETPEQPEVQQNGSDAAVTPPAEAQTTDTATAHMIPKSRFDEVNNQLKEMRTAQEKAAKEREKAERERLEKQNEFKSLYEQAQAKIQELEPVQERYNSFLTQTSERNTARVEALPKEMRTLVPEYDDPLKLANWLDANEATLTKKTAAPSLDGGAGRTNQGNNAPSLDEIKEQAARLNVNWKHLAQQYGVTVPTN